MPKRTYKPLAYVEPPPTADSSAPGRGVWSDTSGVAVAIGNTQDVLRQAILDALYQLPPGTTDAISLAALPSEMQFDAWTTTRLRLRTPWWQARQWTWKIRRTTGHEHPADVFAIPRPVVIGNAELRVEKIWRFHPGSQSKDVVREGILDEFTRELDRELDATEAKIRRMRPPLSSRRNLRRDATRFVLREYLDLTLQEILDYEDGIPVPLSNGINLAKPGLDFDNEDEDLESDESEPRLNKDETKRRADTVDQSIRNLAKDAGLVLSSRH